MSNQRPQLVSGIRPKGVRKPTPTFIRKQMDRESANSKPEDTILNQQIDNLFLDLKQADLDRTKNRSIHEKISKLIIHTDYYRHYCNQALTRDIFTLINNLLSDLVRFQDRAHKKSPIKARVHRRLVYGLSETSKYINIERLKCVIIGINVKNAKPLNDLVERIVTECDKHSIPVFFGLTVKKLKRITHKRGVICCVGILNYDGAQDTFKQLITHVGLARQKYRENLEEMVKILSQMSENDLKNILESIRDNQIADNFIKFRISLEGDCIDRSLPNEGPNETCQISFDPEDHWT